MYRNISVGTGTGTGNDEPVPYNVNDSMDTRTGTTSTDVQMQMNVNHLNNDLRSVLMPVTVFVGIEALLGFLGNLMVLYIYFFRYHACNFRYFVLNLAVIDMLSCVTTLPGEMFTQLYWYVYPQPVVCKVKSFFNMFTVSASSLVLLLMAVDRYQKVCRPYCWQLRKRFALCTCFFLNIFAFCIALPVPFLWGTRSFQKLYKGSNVTVVICEKDEKYEHSRGPYIYSLTVQVVLCCAMLPMVLFYIGIAKTMYTHAAPGTPVRPPSLSSKGNRLQVRRVSHPFVEGHDSVECEEPLTYGNQQKSVCDKETMTEFIAKEELKREPCDSHKCVPDVPIVDNFSEKTTSSREHLNNRPMTRRARRKTLIIFILTLVFIVTIVLYLTLLSFIAKSDGILNYLSPPSKVLYFFFFRLYFINHVINPILYGLLDPECRSVLKTFCKSRTSSGI